MSRGRCTQTRRTDRLVDVVHTRPDVAVQLPLAVLLDHWVRWSA